MGNKAIDNLWTWCVLIFYKGFSILGEIPTHVYFTSTPWVAYVKAPHKISDKFFEFAMSREFEKASQYLDSIVNDIKNQLGGQAFTNPDFAKMELEIAVMPDVSTFLGKETMCDT